MFSPPQLTVLRCKYGQRDELKREVESKLELLYEKRFMNAPQVFPVDDKDVVCFENRRDLQVKPDRHPCDIRNYDQQVVIIDANCGAAVLRGADIFAPGVVTCTETFVGDVGRFSVY